ncbi:MAG TPA: hypothetical protein HA349_04490 [Methanotrichaceae archaeon]|nr:hypothetical protein [Methanotrichaceae archaeon]
MAEEYQDTSNEGWHRLYPEESIFSRQEVKDALRSFLEGAGYKISLSAPIGFVMPNLVASREIESERREMIFVVGEGINDAVRGFRDLAAAKLFCGVDFDYVLVLPPVSEHFLIEFLIEKEDWFFPIKDQLFQLWLVNPEKETVDCLIGWPRDGTFKDHFSNPILAEFAGYIANKAGDKMMREEFGDESWELIETSNKNRQDGGRRGKAGPFARPTPPPPSCKRPVSPSPSGGVGHRSGRRPLSG